jgi:hypothetical protein
MAKNQIETNWVADRSMELLKRNLNSVFDVVSIATMASVDMVLAVLTHGNSQIESVSLAIAEIKRKFRVILQSHESDKTKVDDALARLTNSLDSLGTAFRFCIKNECLPVGDVDSEYLSALRETYANSDKLVKLKKQRDSLDEKIQALENADGNPVDTETGKKREKEFGAQVDTEILLSQFAAYLVQESIAPKKVDGVVIAQFLATLASESDDEMKEAA